MTRTDIINHLIKVYNYKSYLEIGVSDPKNNFDLINCRFRIGVDPNGKATFTGTSDEFFMNNKFMFDIIFIDGLHEELQVTKDINNALLCLNKNGMIVLHDCLPTKEEYQTEQYNGGVWSGTVWRSIAKIRMTRNDLELSIINTDWGCGVLKRGHSKLFVPPLNTDLNYEFFFRYANEMFNIISPQQFLEKYK